MKQYRRAGGQQGMGRVESLLYYKGYAPSMSRASVPFSDFLQ